MTRLYRGILPARHEVRERARQVVTAPPRELTPIAAKPIYDPTRDRAWAEMAKRIDTNKAMKAFNK